MSTSTIHRSSSILMIVLHVFCCLNLSNCFNLPAKLHSPTTKLRLHHLASSRATTYLQLTSDELTDTDWDLAVIGGGPVGVSAALLAARAPYNKKVLLIDAPRNSGALMDEAKGEDLSIGGPTGLFSKALRDTGKRISVSSLKGMGLRDDSVWNEIVTSCLELAASNARDTVRQLEYAGISYVQGNAAFADSGGSSSLFITSDDNSITSIQASKILVASGSTPFRPGGIPFDGKRVFDSDSINTLSYLPKSVAIVGSGIIAVEFAKIFKNLGADVTLIIRDDNPLRCDIYLAAVGRKPNTASLNLQAAGVRTDSYGGIEVDSELKATSSGGNVYAAGDVLGRPFLASTGMAQGFAAIRIMFNDDVSSSAETSKGYSNSDMCSVGDLSMTGDNFDPKSLGE
eukprot:scaffold5067_cov161-Skeletonema_menzelii.AAC.4